MITSFALCVFEGEHKLPLFAQLPLLWRLTFSVSIIFSFKFSPWLKIVQLEWRQVGWIANRLKEFERSFQLFTFNSLIQLFFFLFFCKTKRVFLVNISRANDVYFLGNGHFILKQTWEEISDFLVNEFCLLPLVVTCDGRKNETRLLVVSIAGFFRWNLCKWHFLPSSYIAPFRYLTFE